MVLVMTIAKRLKEFKNVKHLTASELANILGIPVRTVGSYERGEVLPGAKFFNLLINNFNVNINWLLTGRGTMFINEDIPVNKDSIAQLQEEIQLSNDDMQTLISMLKSEASRNMILKFLEIKRGNKAALDSLIDNLKGIRAVY